MQSITTKNNLQIVYEEEDAETAQLLQDVFGKTADILLSKWNLSLPQGTQVHVMRSWLRFPFHASSWPRKVLLALTLPVWAYRARKIWAFTGGWTLPYPRQPAIGVKPPSLLQTSDHSMGRRIFVEGMDESAKVQMITCHELTHASTAFLKLPAWLNEGLAMISVDEYFGCSTVQVETLSSVKKTQPKISPRGYRQLHRADKETLLYLYVRGYWITRFFDQQFPDVLTEVLSKRRHQNAFLNILADALNLKSKYFWQHIDDIVVNYFD